MDNFNDNRAFMKSGFDLPVREFISDQERGMPTGCIFMVLYPISW